MKTNDPKSLSNLLANRRAQYKQEQKRIVSLAEYINKHYKVKPNINQTPTKLIILVNSASAASQLRFDKEVLEKQIESDQEIIIKVAND